MCRMMGVVSPHGIDAELVAAFRQQARGHVAPGDSPGHADGWGIAYYDDAGHPAYAGRSTGDAATDPLYPAAVDELRKLRPKGPLLAHVRKASVGALSVENTHPFTIGRWSFCHNGTVWGFAPEGKSDSRAIFEALEEDIRKRKDVLGAFRRLVDEVSCLRYTSLTCLLSDGHTLYALRKVGNVDEACRPAAPAGTAWSSLRCGEAACDPEYYTLGIARIGDHTVVSQEHEFLGLGGEPWRVVPDAHVAIIDAHGRARVEPI